MQSPRENQDLFNSKTVSVVEPPKKPSSRAGKRQPKSARRETAETMALKQKDIAVSEFFAKNRHLLGFDNPRKALLTTVKEAVDNSLDACEEAGILPNVAVIIEDLQPDRPATAKQSRYRVTVIDNGPGIVRKQVENVFGRLLFGSKFHRLKMSRGQQGIGISAAGMYGLITTGKPMVIHTRPSASKPAHHIELAMNTKTNRAEVTVDKETQDFPPQRLKNLDTFVTPEDFITGTSVSIELEGRYQKGRGSVDEFLELCAIANPHARIAFVPPTRVSADEQEDLPLAKAAGDSKQTDSSEISRARRNRSDVDHNRKRRRDFLPARDRSASAGDKGNPAASQGNRAGHSDPDDQGLSRMPIAAAGRFTISCRRDSAGSVPARRANSARRSAFTAAPRRATWSRSRSKSSSRNFRNPGSPRRRRIAWPPSAFGSFWRECSRA